MDRFKEAGFEPMDLGGGLWAYVREAEEVVSVLSTADDDAHLPDVESAGRVVCLSIYPLGGVGSPASLMLLFADAETFLNSLI